jgi:predicted RNA-binding protein with RPS1 domain
MGEKEKKEESWLRQLCGDDVKLYDVLASSLFFDPIAALPKEDLGVLIEAAEKSVKDANYEEAITKYRWALDKAIFEATQHQEEKDRYIKLIQDLLSKSTQATEKVREKAEKEGRIDRLGSLGRGTEYCKFVSERIEDVLEVARHFYDETLKVLGEKERGETRLEEKREQRRKEDTERKKPEEKRDKKGEKERREKGVEEDREEERERQREKETGEARRKKILEARK